MYFGVKFFSLCRELVQVVMAAAGEVGLQNFPKQIPLQQAVGHGQELLDNLVEILEGVRKPKINDFLTTRFAWPKFFLCLSDSYVVKQQSNYIILCD